MIGFEKPEAQMKLLSVVVGLLSVTLGAQAQLVQAQLKTIAPAQAPTNPIYSPGVDAGDYVYLSLIHI